MIGASSAEPEVLAVAESVGEAIARQGWHLICGGGEGVMGAACRGFQRGRGAGETPVLALGVLPGEDASAANPYVDVAIPSGLGIARNALITRAAGAVIAIGGCSGTLSEIAFAWQQGRPIVAMGGTGGWAGELAGRAVDGRRDDRVLEARTAEAAVALVAQALGGDR